MVHPHTVHLPRGALLIWRTMCGTGVTTMALGEVLHTQYDDLVALSLALFVVPLHMFWCLGNPHANWEERRLARSRRLPATTKLKHALQLGLLYFYLLLLFLISMYLLTYYYLLTYKMYSTSTCCCSSSSRCARQTPHMAHSHTVHRLH